MPKSVTQLAIHSVWSFFKKEWVLNEELQF